MTTTAQGRRLPCDQPNCNAPATVDKGAFGFCAEHGDYGTPAAPRPTVVRTDLSRAHTPPVTLDLGGGATQTMPAPVGGIGLLLEQAGAHSSKRVQNLADRIETQLEQLRALIADLADDEKRKQAEFAAKAAAKAKVARLEAELAAAKAALRRKPPSGTPAKPAPARHTVDQQLACRKGCGRTSPNPQGRGAHERHCTAVAS